MIVHRSASDNLATDSFVLPCLGLSLIEGLPGVWGNKGTDWQNISGNKGTISLLLGNGNKTVQVRGQKHFDVRNKERYL